MATMIERTVILPAVDNDGHSLASVRRDVERQFLAIAGGFTSDQVRGAWLDNGQVYRDKSTRYTMAVTPEQDAAIMARLPEWCAQLRQLCLYTASRNVDVVFVEPAAAPVAAA